MKNITAWFQNRINNYLVSLINAHPSIREAINTQAGWAIAKAEEHLQNMANKSIERAMDGLDLEQMAQEEVSKQVENVDLTDAAVDAVRDALGEADFTDGVEEYMSGYHGERMLANMVSDAVDELDLTDKVGEALEEHIKNGALAEGLQEQIENAITSLIELRVETMVAETIKEHSAGIINELLKATLEKSAQLRPISALEDLAQSLEEASWAVKAMATHQREVITIKNPGLKLVEEAVTE